MTPVNKELYHDFCQPLMQNFVEGNVIDLVYTKTEHTITPLIKEIFRAHFKLYAKELR